MFIRLFNKIYFGFVLFNFLFNKYVCLIYIYIFIKKKKKKSNSNNYNNSNINNNKIV